MKIAISTDGQNLDSQVSPIFGRCPYFTLADVEENEITSSEVIENSAMDQSSGAGTAAAQLIGDEGADAVISGGIGPKAFSALKKWDMEIYQAEPGSVKENIEELLAGELEKVDSPSGPAGMGMGGQEKEK